MNSILWLFFRCVFHSLFFHCLSFSWCLSRVVSAARPCFPEPDCIVRITFDVYNTEKHIFAVSCTAMYEGKKYETSVCIIA